MRQKKETAESRRRSAPGFQFSAENGVLLTCSFTSPHATFISMRTLAATTCACNSFPGTAVSITSAYCAWRYSNAAWTSFSGPLYSGKHTESGVVLIMVSNMSFLLRNKKTGVFRKIGFPTTWRSRHMMFRTREREREGGGDRGTGRE